MGRRTERFRAHGKAAGIQGDIAARERERQRTEDQLGYMEHFLGSDEQMAGYGIDPALLPFTKRYEVEAETLGGLGGAGWGHDNISFRGVSPEAWNLALENFPTQTSGGHTTDNGVQVPVRELPFHAGGVSKWGENTRDFINLRLQEAEDLARQAIESGDDAMLQEAHKLREEAVSLVQTFNPGKLGPERQLWTGAFNLVDDPTKIAQSKLGSSMAMTVGGLVRDAREFGDRESETSRNFLRDLTAQADRTFAAQHREVRRDVADVGRSLGAGRNPYLERALAARSEERIAGQRADVAAQASNFFETFRREFAANTTAFAQAWLQNQSGIREQYQGALDALTTSATNFANLAADRNFKFALESAQFSQEDKDQTWARVGDVIGFVGKLVSGAAGFKKGGSQNTGT